MRAPPPGARANSGTQGDERDGREVLEQQDGEGKPAVTRAELALLLQHLQRKGSG